MSRLDELRQRVIRRFEQFRDSREPRHEVIWGLMGDPAGTVAVTGQSGKVWCRLFGKDSASVRAWNSTAPLINDLRVDVEVERQEGMPADYFVLGVSRVGYGGYADKARHYVPPHHETHEYLPGVGGYDIVNVYNRALAELRADAQVPPDMTLTISSGLYLTEDTMVVRSRADSPTFSAAPGAGLIRYDLLYLDTADNQYKISEGTAAPAGVASRPMPGDGHIPIAWVLFQSGDTAILFTMIIDARVLYLPIGVIGVGTHPLDPLVADAAHTGTLKGLHAHADNENKSGECDGTKTVFITAQEFSSEGLHVFLNGQLLTLNDDYTEGAFYDSFTMSVAPITGDNFMLSYVAQWA